MQNEFAGTMCIGMEIDRRFFIRYLFEKDSVNEENGTENRPRNEICIGKMLDSGQYTFLPEQLTPELYKKVNQVLTAL